MHFQLEVQMRAGRPSGHPHGANRVALADAKTLTQAGCDRLQMRIQRRMLAVMPNLDDVAVTTLPTGKGDHAFSDRAHIRTSCRCIVNSAMRGVISENRMRAAAAETRTNARVLEWRAQECLLQTAAVGCVEAAVFAAVREPVSGDALARIFQLDCQQPACAQELSGRVQRFVDHAEPRAPP